MKVPEKLRLLPQSMAKSQKIKTIIEILYQDLTDLQILDLEYSGPGRCLEKASMRRPWFPGERFIIFSHVAVQIRGTYMHFPPDHLHCMSQAHTSTHAQLPWVACSNPMSNMTTFAGVLRPQAQIPRRVEFETRQHCPDSRLAREDGNGQERGECSGQTYHVSPRCQ